MNTIPPQNDVPNKTLVAYLEGHASVADLKAEIDKPGLSKAVIDDIQSWIDLAPAIKDASAASMAPTGARDRVLGKLRTAIQQNAAPTHDLRAASEEGWDADGDDKA